jgi:hypothetical protein
MSLCINGQISDYMGNCIIIYKKFNNLTKNFLDTITAIQGQLQKLENNVIAHKKISITREDLIAGKLVQQTIHDAIIINDACNQFFTLLNDICHEVELAAIVPIIPSHSFSAKEADIASGKIMQGVSSIAIEKQLDDAVKNAKSIHQRVLLLLKAIIGL